MAGEERFKGDGASRKRQRMKSDNINGRVDQ